MPFYLLIPSFFLFTVHVRNLLYRPPNFFSICRHIDVSSFFPHAAGWRDWIAIGKTDFLYQQNADLRKWLDSKGYPYKYRETDGGHIWRNWRIYLSEFSQMIFK
jgi:hypothetical protein